MPWFFSRLKGRTLLSFRYTATMITHLLLSTYIYCLSKGSTRWIEPCSKFTFFQSLQIEIVRYFIQDEWTVKQSYSLPLVSVQFNFPFSVFFAYGSQNSLPNEALPYFHLHTLLIHSWDATQIDADIELFFKFYFVDVLIRSIFGHHCGFDWYW